MKNGVEGAESYAIGQYEDAIEVARGETIMNHLGERIVIDHLIDQIYEDSIVPEGNIWKINDEEARVTTKERYVFLITVNKTTYLGKNIVPEAGGGNIAIGKETWSEGKATVLISKSEELPDNLKIQYQINGKEEGKWQEGETVTELAHNDIVYARLWDGTNGGNFIEHTIKDEKKPNVTIAVTNVTENSVTVQATGEDNETGIETYEFQISSTGEEETYETKNTDLKATNYTFTGLTGTSTYYIRCRVTDGAKNQNENAEHTHQILNNSGCSTINRHYHTAQTGSCYRPTQTTCNGILKCYNWETMTGFTRHWCRCTVCNREAIIDAWNYGNTQTCGDKKTTGYQLTCTYENGQIITPSVINQCSQETNQITIKIKS